MRNQILYIDGF